MGQSQSHESSFLSPEHLPRPRSVHEGLVRERDQKHDFDAIYEVLDDIGRGGLCRVYKIRKKEDKIGGSSRPEHVRKRSLSSVFHTKHKRGASAVLDASLGNMSSVDSSAHPSLLFALKTVNLKLVPKDRVEQLKNEVECLKTLDHKNIIKAYETFVPKDSPKLMIVMELCTGGDLFSRIPYTEDEAANVTRQILSAVAYMHDRNIIHRDIKMENIVFESRQPESPIKVIDFGLSRKYSPKDDILVERVGTLYSMAPETMKGAYDEKADLWSIGVCAYALLGGGTKPFDGKTPKELVAKVLVGSFEFDGELWDTVSNLAKDFIIDLLANNPKSRPTAREAHVHPWISERSKHGSAHSETTIDEAFRQRVRDCIVRYADNGPFRKLALNVIAKRSTSAEIFQLRKIFDEFDTDDSGLLTYEQFKEALAHSNFNDEEVEKIFRSVDINQNNVVNYTEFLAACLEAQGELAEYRLAEAFDIMDSDDSGYISKDNLRKILGKHSDERFIDALIAEADFTKNGKISYEEFLQVFSVHQQRRVSEIYPEVGNKEKTEAVLKHHGFIGNFIGRIQSVSSLQGLRRNISAERLPRKYSSGDSAAASNGVSHSSEGSQQGTPMRRRRRRLYSRDLKRGGSPRESPSGSPSSTFIQVPLEEKELSEVSLGHTGDGTGDVRGMTSEPTRKLLTDSNKS